MVQRVWMEWRMWLLLLLILAVGFVQMRPTGEVEPIRTYQPKQEDSVLAENPFETLMQAVQDRELAWVLSPTGSEHRVLGSVVRSHDGGPADCYAVLTPAFAGARCADVTGWDLKPL